MRDEITDTKDFLQLISDEIHFFVKDSLSGGWIVQLGMKLVFLALVIYVLDLLFKLVINFAFKFFINNDKYPALLSIHKARVTNSIAHIMALSFGKFALYSVFYQHAKSYPVIERVIDFVMVMTIAGLLFRCLKAYEHYNVIKGEQYKIVAIRAVSQTIRIFAISVFSVIGLCIILGVPATTILGSLGAFTAVIVLVFRDTILGFVTGIHVALNKNLKVGDWISIPKYPNLEGTIEDIDLLTTKIQNFDKTVSTIPTYDLLSTEIKNIQVMSETNTRRIKKSIIFNIKSFHYVTEEEMERFSNINLIRDYMKRKKEKMNEVDKNNRDSHELLNVSQLTNIGTFRRYALHYLQQNPNVDQNGIVMVRQMEITPQGLPLEIYCFANKSDLVEYEQIQADIFDHLLVASQHFNLEIMQMNINL